MVYWRSPQHFLSNKGDFRLSTVYFEQVITSSTEPSEQYVTLALLNASLASLVQTRNQTVMIESVETC